MGREHKHRLKEQYREVLGEKPVLTLNIPDALEPLAPPLVELVKREVSAVLHRAASIKIYDLALESEHIARMQKVLLESPDLGVTTEHGLLCSEEWWQAVADGRLITRTESGVVMRVDETKMGTHFWMKCKGNDRFRRCLRTKIAGVPLTRRKLAEIYLVGSHVRICRVETRAQAGGRHSRTLEVWLSPPQPGDGPVPTLAKG
jgi:hypothetical protein